MKAKLKPCKIKEYINNNYGNSVESRKHRDQFIIEYLDCKWHNPFKTELTFGKGIWPSEHFIIKEDDNENKV